MKRMKHTIFDKPQWSWRRAYKERDHAGVSNRVSLTNRLGQADKVLVVVPAGFIAYVLSIGGLTKDRLGEVDLYLEQDTDKPKRWVFGYYTDGNLPHDLWHYNRKDIPQWLAEGRYTLLNQ